MLKTQYLILLGISKVLLSCVPSTKKVDNHSLTYIANETALTQKETNRKIADTSNQYIYDFMKVVIADQKLELSCGLTIKPESNCDLFQDDITFLNSLLIEKSKFNQNISDGSGISIIINTLPKCLTQTDIDEMLHQKEKLSNFVWDNSRLGFNISNEKYWYCFSRPLFSINRKKVVMMIRKLCPGLCGTGWTVVFTKQGNKWFSQTGGQWVH